jgi:nucleotide-binding universal stress UspA family protein
MLSRVLVPMDGSDMAEQALEYALEAYPDAEITVLHVVGEPSAMMGAAVALALEADIEAAANERAATLFERARELAEPYDSELATAVAWGSPAKEILNRADSFDTVVIGSHGGSLTDRFITGNVAQKVVRRSPVPVTVVR